MTTRPTKPIRHLERKLRCGLAATYASLGLLLLVFLAWNFVRESGPNWVVFAVQVLPLAMLLPGMISGHYRSFSWLCFVILIYFIKAVDGVAMSDATLMDSVFLVLTIVVFIAAMLTSRWAQRKVQENLYVQNHH